jgi:DMSO/TMAO reductase YedYZ heme-binding membrane subunit
MNSLLLYVIAILIASASLLYDNTIFSLIATGTLGLSFYIVVMYTGVLKSGSKIKKQISSVRKDYAILGFIFITPHAYLHILDVINKLIPLQYFALLSIILMVPLFITSFKLFRHQMLTSNWIKLHRIAYLIYALIFLHAVSVSGGNRIIVYYLIFGLYSIFALNKRFSSHTYLKATTITILIGSFSLLFVNNIVDYLEKPINIIEGNDFEDGIYIGYAKGYQNLDTIVRVSIRNNHIEYVIIEECGCTPFTDNGYYSNVAYKIATEVRTKGKTDIDSISGATQTSIAINKAVIDALNDALIK